MGRGSQKIPALNFNRANGKHFQELAASLVKPIDLVTNHPSPPLASSRPSPQCGRTDKRANTLLPLCSFPTFPSLFSPSLLVSFFLSFFLLLPPPFPPLVASGFLRPRR